jgi:hypothetical protein
MLAASPVEFAMRHLLPLSLVSVLSACALPPLPPDNPKMAWVDLYTQTGRLVMAERLDGKRLEDGRYFQVTPGPHTLLIRFDYEITWGARWNDPQYRTCYLRVEYPHFEAGQRYRLEGWVLGISPEARLHDASGAIVADDNQQSCLF